MIIRALSYGGGVQSTALLVLAATKQIDVGLAIFADVGADSENPETLRLVFEVYAPWAESHGIEVAVVRRILRNGTDAPGIREWVRNDKRSVRIPVRMSGNGAPGHRTCTDLYKRIPIQKELTRRGATSDDPAVIVLGISADEALRMRSDSGFSHVAHAYPDTYPLVANDLSRADCVEIIRRANLPVPPKSSCTFCLFHDLSYWRELRRTNPTQFDLECAFEDEINRNRAAINRTPVYFHPKARPLRDAVNSVQLAFDVIEASCAIGGYCHS